MDYDAIADALIALNNSAPRLPHKHQIVEVLKGAAEADGDPNIKIAGCALGASMSVTADSRISFSGFHVGVRPG